MTRAARLWLYLVAAFLVRLSEQHGRMIEPPSRSSMWRFGFSTPANYNDNELYCGGRSEIQRLGGLCGVCGDPYHGRRENEAGGRYATGTIAREYPSGTPTITVRIELTAWHMGHYEFRICPHNNPSKPVTQKCLNKYPLPVAESSDDEPTHYKPERGGIHEITLLLPPGIACNQCVLQWRYRAGNSWGTDVNGRGCLGCGVQEEFRNCADIKIGDNSTASSTDKHFVEEVEPVFNQKQNHNHDDFIQPFGPDNSNSKLGSKNQQPIPEKPNHRLNTAEFSTSTSSTDKRFVEEVEPVFSRKQNHKRNDIIQPFVSDISNRKAELENQQPIPETPNHRLNIAEFSTSTSSTDKHFVEKVEPVFIRKQNHNRNDIIQPFVSDISNRKVEWENQQLIPGTPNRRLNVAEIPTKQWNDPGNIPSRMPNKPIFSNHRLNEFKASPGHINDAENIIETVNVPETDFPNLKTTEIATVKTQTSTRQDEQRGNDRRIFQGQSEDRDWFSHRPRDPLINLPSRREHNTQRALHKKTQLGQIKPTGQIPHRDNIVQEHDRRNTLWRDRNINNHFSEISRPRDLNEMIHRRNRGMLDSTGRNGPSNPAGHPNGRRLIINRTFMPRKDAINNVRETAENFTPVRGGVFRNNKRFERPRQAAIENNSKKTVHKTSESSRAKLRKSFDRNNRIRDLWRKIVLLSRFKMLRKSLSKKNTNNNFSSRTKSFPVALPFKIKTRTVSLSDTPPDKEDITSKGGNILFNTQRNSNPSTKSKTKNARDTVVKTYKNKYNKTSSSSLEGSKSNSAWYENLLHHAKKQKAKVISNNKVKLSDSTVIRIPKGSVFGR